MGGQFDFGTLYSVHLLGHSVHISINSLNAKVSCFSFYLPLVTDIGRFVFYLFRLSFSSFSFLLTIFCIQVLQVGN